MEKLELKHLKHYLGTSLKFRHKSGEAYLNTGTIGLLLNTSFYSDPKLLLHPLSRLIEPILEGGRIPIIELAKHSFSGISIPEINNFEISQNNNEVSLVYFKGKSTFFFSYSKKWGSFHWSKCGG